MPTWRERSVGRRIATLRVVRHAPQVKNAWRARPESYGAFENSLNLRCCPSGDQFLPRHWRRNPAKISPQTTHHSHQPSTLRHCSGHAYGWRQTRVTKRKQSASSARISQAVAVVNLGRRGPSLVTRSKRSMLPSARGRSVLRTRAVHEPAPRRMRPLNRGSNRKGVRIWRRAHI